MAAPPGLIHGNPRDAAAITGLTHDANRDDRRDSRQKAPRKFSVAELTWQFTAFRFLVAASVLAVATPFAGRFAFFKGPSSATCTTGIRKAGTELQRH